ncbi:hypothetical protein IGI47_001674 [Enterococcus sp. AZ191]|uniref:hypothetical protein n=1 Tax=Enterococcus sp. AZ191 TaxID=2774639 RepID=UPI003F1E95DD
MPFVAILLDLLAAGAYFLQLNHQTETLLLIGLIFQGIVTLILCFMTIIYKGNRYAAIQPRLFIRYVSIRYAIIIYSFIINTVFLFLYVLNFLDINPLVFPK